MNNRKWLLFVLTVHTTVVAGRQEKERPLQSQRSTAGVAVGLVKLNKSVVHVQLLTLHQIHTRTHKPKQANRIGQAPLT